jgi:hypothetical protein
MIAPTPKVPLPQPTDSGRALYDYAREMDTFLMSVPVLEYKSITTVAGFPIYVQTQIRNVVEVRRAQSYETRNTAAAIDNTSVAWRKSEDPRKPGILITELGGLTAGTDYTVVLAIQGTR